MSKKVWGKNMFLNRRNFLLGIGAFFLFSKKSFSDQTSLNELMRKQFLGSNNAPIKIKEFFSLTCGHCSNFHIKTLPQLKKKYIDTGKVQLEFIDYPLDRLAVIAATLARSIPTKDGYIEAVSILLKKQKQWAYSKNPLNELQSIAKLFGISSKKLIIFLKTFLLCRKLLQKWRKSLKTLI
jgi:protein-disulfide isomerase